MNKYSGGAAPITKLRLNPIFRWAGSKRKQLSALESHWNTDFTRYVEPFAGSAALFFHLQPQQALLGDINAGLIEAYDVVRSKPDDLYHAVTSLPKGEDAYYVERDKDPRCLCKFDRAVRFVYLNRHCFNGIFRTNTEGKFNVPYAHSRAGAIPPIEDFRRAALLLARASLKCADFGRILSSVRSGDFVFLDPPYAVASRRVFRQYDKRAFTPRDLVRLSKHLYRIDECGAKFVMTYAQCSEVATHFQRWDRRRIRVRRHVAGFAGARRSAYEVLITNLGEGR
ncbi:MAG TPA: Dam family site-specific DNA-(adenine-N6)-methyltransferase [Kiritimatiellia bacterium]|nr:Dam family site-specific DNA-(adenine-N6)-methyltransferase [Kiritimatiellia bacterium]HMP35357.1 Dam family site-specific DNA-(adenine-N6)-methyltransferase [Kiritimatiellia bacterium]